MSNPAAIDLLRDPIEYPVLGESRVLARVDARARTAEDSATSDQVAGQEPFELAATTAGRIYSRLGV
jgi:hypothetical protein